MVDIELERVKACAISVIVNQLDILGLDPSVSPNYCTLNSIFSKYHHYYDGFILLLAFVCPLLSHKNLIEKKLIKKCDRKNLI